MMGCGRAECGGAIWSIFQTGSHPTGGRSPMLSSHASETTLNDGHKAPMEVRSSRPDTSRATVHDHGGSMTVTFCYPAPMGRSDAKRDHRPRGRVTNDKAATPLATLRNGLVSTTGGSASVPGCACDCMHPPPSPRDPPVSGCDK